MKRSKPETVDNYIAAATPRARPKLKAIRKAIRQAAPKALEKISYRMPYYAYKGRLAYFAAFQNHISLFVPTPVVAEHKRELRNYETAAGTVRFPMEMPVPIWLVKKLVKARLKLNEKRAEGSFRPG